MKLLISLLFISSLVAQDLKTVSPQQSSATVPHTAPTLVVATVGALPSTGCSAGELAVVTGATLGQQIYENSGTGTCVWTQQLNSGGGGGGVTSVTGTAPISSSGGTTPALSCSTCATSSPTNHGVAVGASTQALSFTAAGTAGQVLTSNGASADPTFQAAASNPNFGALVSLASQVIVTATATPLSFSLVRDDGGFYSAGSPTKLTIPTGGAGWYAMQCGVISNGSGFTRALQIYKNGAITNAGFPESAWNGASIYGFGTTGLAYLADADFITCVYEQFQGSNETIGASSMSLVRIN